MRKCELKISIAMATYNGNKYLREQLDSFCTQTRLPDELVVTDDCSTDDTLAIVESFAASAPFEVRWARNEMSLGYSGNFNKALMETTGDLVFLSDQDDVWFPEKIERMSAIAANDPHNVVFMNDAALADAELNVTGRTKLEQIRSAGYKESAFVMGCCIALKRELLTLCLPIPDGYHAHDSWIVRIAEGIGRRRILREVLQYYRRHEDNESQWIANRTSRVTLLNVGLFYLGKGKKGHLRSPSDAVAQAMGMQLPTALIRRWALTTLSRAPEAYRAEIREFAERLERRIELEERRRRVQEVKGARRVASAAVFWLRGGYKEFTGAKSMLKDIVAPLAER